MCVTLVFDCPRTRFTSSYSRSPSPEGENWGGILNNNQSRLAETNISCSICFFPVLSVSFLFYLFLSCSICFFPVRSVSFLFDLFLSCSICFVPICLCLWSVFQGLSFPFHVLFPLFRQTYPQNQLYGWSEAERWRIVFGLTLLGRFFFPLDPPEEKCEPVCISVWPTEAGRPPVRPSGRSKKFDVVIISDYKYGESQTLLDCRTHL